MINKNELAERRYKKIQAAGMRWQKHLPEMIEANKRLISLGSLGAASQKQKDRYLSRQAFKAIGRPAGIGQERKIGPRFEFDSVPPTVEAMTAGQPVARIVELLGGGRIGEGFATGFLVHGPILMTNWHIFANPGDAVGVGAQFGFQKNENGLIESGVVYELDPEQFFISDEELDIAIVGISKTSTIGAADLDINSFGDIHLVPTVGKILIGQPVSIIQHPDGMHKQWAVRENKLRREPAEDEIFLEYSTDTMPGSSGSPAFNTDWELVAVHHSGVPRMEGDNVLLRNGDIWKPGDSDQDIDWVANEGARVSKIIAYLKSLTLGNRLQAALLNSLLAHSTDTLMMGTHFMPNDNKHEIRSTQSQQKTMPGSAPSIIVNGTAHIHFHTDASLQAVGIESGVPISPANPSPQTLEKKIKFDPNYDNRPGYDERFLDGFRVPLPRAPLDQVIKHGRGQKILRYHHYSLAMHKDRRFAIWAASNIDYNESKRWRTRKQLGTDTWKADPRILGEQQVEDQELYDPAKKFDRGHLIRRDDVAWGETKLEEEYGNSDSFHWTNCTPQHEEFNRAIFQFDGLWGGLENHIGNQSKYLGHRMIVFTGPILSEDDPYRDFGGGDIQVPIGFWKVVIAVEQEDGNTQLRSYGFILSQQDAIDEFGWENRFRAGRFKEQQESIAEIASSTGVTFPDIVLESDGYELDSNEGRRSLRTYSDIRL